MLAKKEEVISVEVTLVDVSKIVDTNSAGDSFCGGYDFKWLLFSFIAELLNGADLVKCAKAGNYSASQTI